MFETCVTQKIIIDSGITQYLITIRNLIHDNYDNYIEYQTEFKKVLLFYGKDTLLLLLNNSFSKLSNIWYAPDVSFNLISIIQLGEKKIEIWLQIIDQPS